MGAGKSLSEEQLWLLNNPLNFKSSEAEIDLQTRRLLSSTLGSQDLSTK